MRQEEVRRARGRKAERSGRTAETRAEEALVRDGWDVVARRLRNAAGEIDLIAEREGVAAFIEVKSRPTLGEAAFALQPRQQSRVMAAAEIALAEHPAWGHRGVRFDVLLVDLAGQVRRVVDAFRLQAAYS